MVLPSQICGQGVWKSPQTCCVRSSLLEQRALAHPVGEPTLAFLEPQGSAERARSCNSRDRHYPSSLVCPVHCSGGQWLWGRGGPQSWKQTQVSPSVAMQPFLLSYLAAAAGWAPRCLWESRGDRGCSGQAWNVRSAGICNLCSCERPN